MSRTRRGEKFPPIGTRAVDIRLECEHCAHSFPASRALTGSPLLPAPNDKCYSFVCSKCSPSQTAIFAHTPKRWTDVASTALFNLERRSRRNQQFFQLEKDIVPFVDANWKDLCLQRERTVNWASALHNNIKAHHEVFDVADGQFYAIKDSIFTNYVNSHPDDDDSEENGEVNGAGVELDNVDEKAAILEEKRSFELSLSQSFSPNKAVVTKGGSWCHQCKQRRDEIITCRDHQCGKRYCGKCLSKHYGQNINEINLATWKCPVSEGTCECSVCRKKAHRTKASIAAATSSNNIRSNNIIRSSKRSGTVKSDPMEEERPLTGSKKRAAETPLVSSSSKRSRRSSEKAVANDGTSYSLLSSVTVKSEVANNSETGEKDDEEKPPSANEKKRSRKRKRLTAKKSGKSRNDDMELESMAVPKWEERGPLKAPFSAAVLDAGIHRLRSRHYHGSKKADSNSVFGPNGKSHALPPSILDLIRAGVLHVGDKITYKDHPTYEATLRADGQLQQGSVVYNTLSQFAKAVAVKVDGGSKSQIYNGWTLLKCRGSSLEELRSTFITNGRESFSGEPGSQSPSKSRRVNRRLLEFDDSNYNTHNMSSNNDDSNPSLNATVETDTLRLELAKGGYHDWNEKRSPFKSPRNLQGHEFPAPNFSITSGWLDHEGD